MKLKLYIFIVFILGSASFYAQNNSIKINVVLKEETDVLKIQQEIVFHNKTNQALSEIYLHNWANSFQHKNTPLTNRLIEDYNKSLYFAKEKERGFATILNLTTNYKVANFSSEKNKEDILKIELNESLNPNDSTIINITYTVKIPDDKFTGYGKTKTGYHLRFWHLTPAVYNI